MRSQQSHAYHDFYLSKHVRMTSPNQTIDAHDAHDSCACLSHLRHKSNMRGHRWSHNLKEIEGQSRISIWRVLSGPRYSLHNIESIPEQLNFWNAAISRPEILLAGISQTLPVPKRTLI